MTEREMRRLSRADLLEMLIEQSAELEALQAKYAAAQEKLEKREVDLQQAGTLAEAALRFNGVFDAADAAAQEFMDTVRRRSEAQTALCEKLEQESREAAQQLKQDTQQHCAELEAQTKAHCEALIEKAKAEAEECWNQLSVKLAAYSEQYTGICELLSIVRENQTKQ